MCEVIGVRWRTNAGTGRLREVGGLASPALATGMTRSLSGEELGPEVVTDDGPWTGVHPSWEASPNVGGFGVVQCPEKTLARSHNSIKATSI